MAIARQAMAISVMAVDSSRETERGGRHTHTQTHTRRDRKRERERETHTQTPGGCTLPGQRNGGNDS